MLNRIKLKFSKSVKNKRINVFGLFLLIAFLILVVTKLSDTYVETIPFSISYKNLPENNVITLDTVPKVNVTVSTNGFKLLSYYFYDPEYTLDFENQTSIKDNTYMWLAEKGRYDFKQQLGTSVTVVSVKPDTLILPFGILSVKKVPVILKSQIKYASGYDIIDTIKLVPDSVKIIGAAAEISRIDYVETQLVELVNIKDDINDRVLLDFSIASDRLKLSDDNVTIKAQVEQFTEGTFEIPVSILNKPQNVEINYFPKQIKVAYYINLKEYELIKPDDFIIECDYEEVKNTDKLYFTPKLIINSDKVKSANLKQNKVEYIIVK